MSTIPGLVREGRYPDDGNAREIVIGKVLARNLRVSIGDELTLLGSGRDGSFSAAVAEVVGVFESGSADIDRSIAEIPLAFFDDVFYMDGAGHSIVIVVPTLDDVEIVQAKGGGAALPTLAILSFMTGMHCSRGCKQAIQADISSAFFMYGILVILVAFSVMNTQLMSVLERTHEFGIVMSLGVTPGRLGRLVILETGMMALAGLLLGAVVGGLITLWFSYNGFSYPGMDQLAANFNLPSQFYPQVTLLTLFIGPADRLCWFNRFVPLSSLAPAFPASG